MSKTFKSAKSTLELTVVRTNEDLVRIITQLPDETGRAIDLAPSDAPALALAILEAAVGESSRQSAYSERAIDNLRAEVDRMKLEDAEAEAQAKLEAEALELLNSGIGATFKSWPEAVRTNQPSVPNWLAVARRAREINKEGK